ncbi:hypothetical protein Gogos_022225 [Gossypium gossypioides]|uniref:RNase H type-1 domain-containing protein n=1 Tax=Gossypium gossypioides TaxID=34282 RepID=A0A7J9D760_GOSGO|nr:hypothetical protein [Gossypium gossypioides]
MNWNRDKVIELYGNLLGDQICNLPIMHNGVTDRRVWCHNPYGFYTSKSAYSWLSLKKIGCKNREETLIHALKDCPVAHEILTFGGLNNRLIEGSYDRCIDWLEDVLRELDVKAAADFFTLLWNCWNNRNKLVFNGKDDEARVINFDAAVLNGRVGFGVIARDSKGFVIGGSSGFKEKMMSADWAEMEAFDESLKMASILNISNVIFESDCANLVNKVNKREQDITIIGCCVKNAQNKRVTVEQRWKKEDESSPSQPPQDTVLLECELDMRKLSFRHSSVIS